MTGLYLHVPFCVKKCNYCDFYSVPTDVKTLDDYVKAVIEEASLYTELVFDTLYFGGGTPSILGKEYLANILRDIYRTLNLSHMTEATIEVNPESASYELLKTAKIKGFNRISVGVQSLIDEELKVAGRVHNAKQAISAIMEAKHCGFESISADLIIGLPGQDWQSLRYSLESLTRIGIEHLSLYCLSIEPGTPFSLEKPKNLPSDDEQAELYEKAVDFLDRSGFIHYEISNFALPGYECKHNINYWHGGEYIGLGPSAASHIKGKRYKNKPDLDAYLTNPRGQVTEKEELTPEEKAAEETMLRLRLLEEGIDIVEISAKFGESNTEALTGRLVRLVAEGLLIREGSKYRLPANKVLVSNPILARVLGDQEKKES
jgi:oxygen-independent coproporphyrinogen-3 oxidase